MEAGLFHRQFYIQHNARRLEHLASLRLPLFGVSVLEVGAGVGDHSHFYIDRGCKVTITEARGENLDYLKGRYPHHDVRFLDLNDPVPLIGGPWDVTHCYGILYHLEEPLVALTFLARNTGGLLLLETCVDFGDQDSVRPFSEKNRDRTQSISGIGCRATRRWLWNRLSDLFEYVYLPVTQPAHAEFPLDWTVGSHRGLARAMFVASRRELRNSYLVSELIDHQRRSI